MAGEGAVADDLGPGAGAAALGLVFGFVAFLAVSFMRWLPTFDAAMLVIWTFYELVGGLIALVSLPFAVVAGLIVGMPLHRSLTRLGRSSFGDYLAAGCFGGLVLAAAFQGLRFVLAPGPSWLALQFWPFTAAFIVGGAGAGCVFWMLRRPDRLSEEVT